MRRERFHTWWKSHLALLHQSVLCEYLLLMLSGRCLLLRRLLTEHPELSTWTPGGKLAIRILEAVGTRNPRTLLHGTVSLEIGELLVGLEKMKQDAILPCAIKYKLSHNFKMLTFEDSSMINYFLHTKFQYVRISRSSGSKQDKSILSCDRKKRKGND